MDSFAGTMSSSLLCVKGLKAPPLVFSVNITHGFRMYPVAPLNSNLAWFSCRGRSVRVCVRGMRSMRVGEGMCGV